MKRAAGSAVVLSALVALTSCVARTSSPPPGPSGFSEREAAPGEPPPGEPPPAAGGEREQPIECHGDDVVAISDCVIEGEVAVDAHGNCNVTLTNCHIRGSKVAIDAHGNANVVIDGAPVSGVIDQHGNANVVTK